MALEQYVTLESILRHDVTSLDNLLPDGDVSILEMTADETIYTEDDLIDLIDMTKRMNVLTEVLEGLTKKELQIIALRFGLANFLAP
jgi:DNA-directed RNA polymerase sigma subunit (sigma70/sigma32)